MTTLYSGTGASGFEIITPSLPEDKWEKVKNTVRKLLITRDLNYAAKLLSSVPFNLSEGTNDFGDEFHVLHAKVPVDRYVELIELKADREAKLAFSQVASTFSEVGFYVRFIDVSVSTDGKEMVPQPTPETSTHAVERALRDSQQLLQSSGAVSAVDRVHTALHGYLREICKKAKIPVAEQASLTELFKTIRTGHPAFDNIKTGGKESKRLFGALATIVDTLNTLRNQASIAHPNDTILEEAEAILAINCGRTLLNYLDSKL